MARSKAKSNTATNTKQRKLVITRVFNAPREKVWQAWTEPEQFEKWWGPTDFSAPTIKMDLREGGKYLYCMRGAGPDGVVKDFWSTGTYREIVLMEKLVMTDSFADENGNVVPASHYGMSADLPMEFQVTVTFEDQGNKTKMTLTHVGLPGGEMRELAGAGWNESFDKLAASLKTN